MDASRPSLARQPAGRAPQRLLQGPAGHHLLPGQKANSFNSNSTKPAVAKPATSRAAASTTSTITSSSDNGFSTTASLPPPNLAAATAAGGGSISRRLALSATALLPLTASPVFASPSPIAEVPIEAGELAARLETKGDLYQPMYLAPWDPKLIYYPRWMFGEWIVNSTFVSVRTPCGPKFVPAGFLQVAQAPADEGGVGSTYTYNARFFSTLPDTFENNARFLLGLGSPQDAIIADKAYNTRQSTDAFLGYKGAVASVDYDPRDAPLRQTVTLSTMGPDTAPLPPRRLELYVNALRSEAGIDDDNGGSVFRTSELARQVYLAIREAQVTDYEVLNEYRRVGEGKIKGRQRSVLFLQPQDPYYFKTGGRAVVIYDYEFDMVRAPAPEDAPYGAVACVPTPKDVVQCI